MGKGQGSEMGDWVQLGTSAAGAVAGAYFGGPQGAKMGWDIGSSAGQVANKTTGMQSSGQGIAGKAQGFGNTASGAVGAASGISGMTSANPSVTPKVDASKGFSGVTSYGDTAKDVGGTNAWGQALGAGKGNPTIPTEGGFGKLGDLITKSMDTAGSIMKMPQGGGAEGSNLQPMTMTPAPQMAAPQNLSSVIAAQLMNPAAQNRLAYMHPGRM